MMERPRPADAPQRLAGDRPPERRPAEARPAYRRNRAVAIAASLAVHGAILAAIVLFHPSPPLAVEPPPVNATLVMAPRPPLEAPPLPPPPDVKRLAAAKTSSVSNAVELTASEIAGAATAGAGGAGEGGGGGGGGACNMIRRIQAALRKDHLVLAAAGSPETAGKALKVWDGDWVQHTGQDGRGLAAVREAIMWEVGFAPAACRAESVHGLVLMSLNDGPGATRLALGSGVWRWSDLLTTRGVGGH